MKAKLLPPLEPHVHVAGRVSGLDVHDAGAAANGAVLGVDLRVAAPRVDVDVFRLAAERAGERPGTSRSVPGHGSGVGAARERQGSKVREARRARQPRAIVVTPATTRAQPIHRLEETSSWK